MSANTNSGFAFELCFNDVDEFTERARDWDLEFMQTKQGPLQAKLRQFISADFQLGYARIDQSLVQRGLPPAGYITFVVPLNPAMKLKWRGKNVTGNDMLLFPLNGELESGSDHHFEVFTISISETKFATLAEKMGFSNPAILQKGAETRRLAPRQLAELRRSLFGFQEQLHRTGGAVADRSPNTEPMAFDILSGWADAVSPSARRVYRNRRNLLKSVLDLMHQREADSPTVGELCLELNCTGRALEYVFRDHFDLSPKQFLKLRRLNQIRRILQQSDPATTKVSDVLNDWGVWHIGQFSADYKRQFATLPSETLRSGQT
jgi:AraC family ethanolamine operon transcriptional activator